MKKLFYIICIFLCSCSIIPTHIDKDVISEEQTTTQSKRDRDGCIPPLIEFAYPYGDSGLMNPGDRNMLLPENWIDISLAPEMDLGIKGSSYMFQLIRPRTGFDELWVTNETNGKIYFMRSDNYIWKVVGGLDKTASHYFLFLDTENNVWLTNRYEKKMSPKFWRYDEKKNTFDLLFTDLPLQVWDKSSEILSHRTDKDGIFWAVLKVKSQKLPYGTYLLYQFDPIKLKSNINYLFTQDKDPTIEINNEGDIFFVDIDKSILNKYSVKTQKVTYYQIPIDISGTPWVELFYDNEKRLWINDLGWFDFSINGTNPQWYSIVKSPIFIYYLVPAGAWLWTSPKLIFEDKDELIWFSSSSGSGWVDSQNGKWCLITTYESNVFLDNKNELWIFVNGSFYRQQ